MGELVVLRVVQLKRRSFCPAQERSPFLLHKGQFLGAERRMTRRGGP